MLAMIELPEFILKLHESSLARAAVVVAGLKEIGQSDRAVAGSDLLGPDASEYIYIREGLFRFACDGRVTRLFSAGDLVLAGGAAALPGCSMICRDPALITRFDHSDVLAALSEDPDLLQAWLEFQDSESRLMNALVAIQAAEDVELAVCFDTYEAGQSILVEGSRCDHILELISGSASVHLQGQKVAGLKAGTIFGEMSFLTDELIGATVIAENSCMVQKIPKQDFERAIKTRPHLMANLARTLAFRVRDLNKSLISG